MSQNTFSLTLRAAIRQLGEGKERKNDKGYIDYCKWACGCDFHSTDRNGGGILFACEEHEDKE